MCLLEMKGIEKSFGKVQALKGVDFKIDEGEVVGLLGDNGAGKSTLVKIIAGYYHEDKGTIMWQGKQVHFRTPAESRRNGIEVVYQDLALVNLLPVWRNFFLGREIQTKKGIFNFLDKKKMMDISKDALKGLGIEIPNVKSAVAFLSGGQRQTIAVGRGVYFGAKLLVLDEPTAAVSLREVEAILNLVEMVSKKGIAVIFIAHNIYHVHRVADRFVILERGAKIADISKRDGYKAEDVMDIMLDRRRVEK